MRGSTAVLGLAIAGVLLGAACTGPHRIFANAGGGGAGGASSSGGAGGTGGAVTCGDAAHICMPKPPVGWSGPIDFAEVTFGDSVPGCVGDYPTLMGASTLKEHLDEGAASCKCTCDATGIVCTQPIDGCYPTNCAQLCKTPFAITLSPNVCTSFTAGGGANIELTDATPDDPGSCTPQVDNVLPTPVWSREGNACVGATTIPGCSADELCVPSVQSPGKLCIAHAGTLASCPDPFFSQLHAVFDAFDDQRACSDCQCGGATSTCGGSVSFWHLGGCPGQFTDGSVAANACESNAQQMADHAMYVPAPSGSCPQTGAQLTGQVVKSGGVTLCCH